MTKLPLRKVALFAGSALLAVAGIFYFTVSKGTRPSQASVNPAFGQYISSYTAGVISSTARLRVILASDVVDSSQVGQEVDVRLFSFQPGLKGKTVWVDRRTVEFVPDGRMSSGQIYDATFNLSRVMTVPEDFNSFRYSFQVIPQNFEISIDNVRPYEKTALQRQKVEGTLFTADVADNESIEKMLSSRQEGRDLKVTWVHSGEGKQHQFVVEDVGRKETESKVSIEVNGKPLSVDRAETKEVVIPSLGDFRLMQARVVQTPTQHIVLQFSDPLREKQSLFGLITVSGVESLDFAIRENEVLVYPPVRQTGSKTVRIEAGVQNILNYKMKEPATTEVLFEQVAPSVRFLGKGSILPATDGMVLPFEAVNLNSVDVTVHRIYQDNILQFLQVNSLDGRQEMHRVAKKVVRKTIALNTAGVTDLGRWNRFTLDLSTLIQADPGAIYQVKLSFRKSYSAYSCEGVEGAAETSDQFAEEDEDADSEQYGDGDYYEEDYYYYEDYDWEQRDNPCHQSYYTSNRFIRKNILASDLGITCKRGGDGVTAVYVTDIRTTEPLGGVKVDLYNYQQQVIGTAVTSSDGKATIDSKEPAFALIASNNAQRGYLKLTDGEALSVSSFDVSGEQVQRGLKGFLYGDRGVWRPGDSLYLTFVLEDKLRQLPPSHPVVFELHNPQGQLVNRIVRASSENGFYSFATATAADAPTGNWSARIKAGGLNYAQPVKIETVKPNRLKINLDFNTERFTSPDASGALDVKWLHGAPGRGLKAEFEMLMVAAPTTFKPFPDYIFEDPAKSFEPETQAAFSDYTDDEGKAVVNVNLAGGSSAPGFVNVIFRGKVFEESGNFSVDRFSIPYSPYASYAGIKTPEGEAYSGTLYFDTPHQIGLATVDASGKGVSRNNLEIQLYKLDWRWWWDNSYDGIANYVNGSSSRLVKSATARTTNGKGSWTLEMKKSEHEYGRYYLRVTDPVSGHSTGKILYVDEPGWYSRMREQDTGAPAILSFTTGKEAYTIGETVNVTIPSPQTGRALVSIESGSRVLRTDWIDVRQGETVFSFEATSEMTPNVYVHVTMLQPHAQTANDLPVRLYGIQAIRIEDPATRLEPELAMAEELRPGDEVRIRVSEKAGRKMTYTLAIVDEGLLDITRFRTPDPWSRFYSREALGVRTWDVFDDVMGSYGSRLERVLTVGGDGELAAKADDPRANRFKPVVRFFGPFTLEGGSATHSFVMPNYIGSVKAMLVAGNNGAYGNAEKVVPVRKPLMVLATLPRVLGPDEKVSLPVTLFSNDKAIRNVTIRVRAKGPVSVLGEATQTVSMPPSGDLTVNAQLQVAAGTGVAQVEVTATAGGESASDVIDIEVRNPNLPVTSVADHLLEAGKSWTSEVVPIGIAGTNTASLEVSNLPPVNLGARLRYLMQYPYGCVEQTTSAVLPQLYLDQVKVLTEAEKSVVQRNVTAGIERLKSFMERDGGFAYWPGAGSSDAWGTSYAGHFLVEAQGKGYFVPDDMLRKWKKFQKSKAGEWRRVDRFYNTDLMQAYRLYTLALAGAAELGMMNRLKEDPQLSTAAAWMLAASYAKAGQPEAARKVIASLSRDIKPYRELGYSYGSHVRDQALVLETLVLLNEKNKAFDVLKELSQQLSNPSNWMSTQETAMCLKAVGSFAAMEKRGDLRFAVTINGKATQISTQLPIAQVNIPVSGTRRQTIEVVNESGGLLFARVIQEGTPARGQEDDKQSNLSLAVRYVDRNGQDVDVTNLPQGTEFIAEVTVAHPGTRTTYENLALAQVFPSGWEINNRRITNDDQFEKTGSFAHQDIRDDRVYTYFALGANGRKTFRVNLTAAYAGAFYLPAVTCEAMYDNSVFSRKKGMEVQVTGAVKQ